MQRFIAKINDQDVEFTVQKQENGKLLVEIDGKETELDVKKLSDSQYSVLQGEESHDVAVISSDTQWQSFIGDKKVQFTLKDEKQIRREQSSGGTGEASGDVIAPMPGKVVEVEVKEGDPVTKGQGIIIVEAMKMQNEFKAPIDGIIQSIHVNPGDAIEGGTGMVSIS